MDGERLFPFVWDKAMLNSGQVRFENWRWRSRASDPTVLFHTLQTKPYHTTLTITYHTIPYHTIPNIKKRHPVILCMDPLGNSIKTIIKNMQLLYLFYQTVWTYIIYAASTFIFVLVTFRKKKTGNGCRVHGGFPTGSLGWVGPDREVGWGTRLGWLHQTSR